MLIEPAAFAGINLEGVLLPDKTVDSAEPLNENKFYGIMNLLDMQSESNRMDILDKNFLTNLTDLGKTCLVYNSINYEYSSSYMDSACSGNVDCHVFLFDKC